MDQNEYVKSLHHALAQMKASTLLKAECLCDSCLHSVSAILSEEKRTFKKAFCLESLQQSDWTAKCGLCTVVLECTLFNNTVDEESTYQTVVSGNKEGVLIEIEQSFKVLNSIVITPIGET